MMEERAWGPPNEYQGCLCPWSAITQNHKPMVYVYKGLNPNCFVHPPEGIAS